MARIRVEGLDNLSANIKRIGRESKRLSNEVLKEGAEEFIRYVNENPLTPEDKGNLKRSVKILNESDFGQGASIRVGVDFQHTPATRAEKVGDYAQRVHNEIYPYIDVAVAHMKKWMVKHTQSRINKVIGGIFGSVKGFFNRFF